MDPATATIIATAIASAAKGASQHFSGKSEERAHKRRAKETKRESHAGMLQDALQRSAELESHRLGSRQKLGKRKAQSSQETADLVRRAFNI